MRLKRSCLLIAVLVCSFMVMSPVVYAENLLPNEDFEDFKGTPDDNSTDSFDGWKTYIEPEDGKILAIKDGREIVVEASVTEGENNSVIIYTDIDAKPDTEYILSGYVRSVSGVNNGRYRIAASEKQEPYPTYYAVNSNEQTKEFSKFSYKFRTTPDCRILRVAIGLRGNSKGKFDGSARFKKISLEEVKERLVRGNDLERRLLVARSFR